MSAPGSSRYDEEADVLFRQRALEDGWLRYDPHPPGNGRGMWAWYRKNGIVPPEWLERLIPQREMNNWHWGDEDDE